MARFRVQELRAQETLNFCKSFLENIASLAKSQNSAMNQFFEKAKFHVKTSKKTPPEGCVSSKYSSKGSESSFSSSSMSLKSSKSLFKLSQDTKKAKIFPTKLKCKVRES